MTKKQIQSAWNMGQTHGSSPAHKGFAEEMAKKTVMNRLVKRILNTSDDTGLFEETLRETIEGSVESSLDMVTEQAESSLKSKAVDIQFEDESTGNQ